jgi:hypothetical protein
MEAVVASPRSLATSSDIAGREVLRPRFLGASNLASIALAPPGSQMRRAQALAAEQRAHRPVFLRCQRGACLAADAPLVLGRERAPLGLLDRRRARPSGTAVARISDTVPSPGGPLLFFFGNCDVMNEIQFALGSHSDRRRCLIHVGTEGRSSWSAGGTRGPVRRAACSEASEWTPAPTPDGDPRCGTRSSTPARSATMAVRVIAVIRIVARIGLAITAVIAERLDAFGATLAVGARAESSSGGDPSDDTAQFSGAA